MPGPGTVGVAVTSPRIDTSEPKSDASAFGRAGSDAERIRMRTETDRGVRALTVTELGVNVTVAPWAGPVKWAAKVYVTGALEVLVIFITFVRLNVNDDSVLNPKLRLSAPSEVDR